MMIDISMQLKEGMAAWPGSAGVKILAVQSMDDGDAGNASELRMDVHCGTHLDMPFHVLRDGAKSDVLGVDALCGSVFVAEVLGCSVIGLAELERLDIPLDTTRILFKTENSRNRIYEAETFDANYVGLDAEAATALVKRGIRLVGIDYLSIARFCDPRPTHEVLLRSEVIVLEGLCLHGVEQGTYALWCLPLSVAGLEGVPARAVLMNEQVCR